MKLASRINSSGTEKQNNHSHVTRTILLKITKVNQSGSTDVPIVIYGPMVKVEYASISLSISLSLSLQPPICISDGMIAPFSYVK